jgi:hypothetical protein
MSDKFAHQSDSANSPSRDVFALVPSDTALLSPIPKGIYVGSGGDVTLRAVDSQADATYRNLADASYIAVRAIYVRASGTTASNLVAEA